jgi:hypothetical protein
MTVDAGYLDSRDLSAPPAGLPTAPHRLVCWECRVVYQITRLGQNEPSPVAPKFCSWRCRLDFFAARLAAAGLAACAWCLAVPPSPHRPTCPPGLLEAQGGRCPLCGNPVDVRSRGEWWAPSLDHVLPRVAGGRSLAPDSGLSNLRVTHRVCNGDRHALSDAQWFGSEGQAFRVRIAGMWEADFGGR